MVSVSSIVLAVAAAPAALAQFVGAGGVAGSETVSSGSYYNSETSTNYAVPGFGGVGYGGLGYAGLGYGAYGGYGGLGYGAYGGYPGFGYGAMGYGSMGYGGYGSYGGYGYGYGLGRGVGITGAYTGGAAIIGPSGSIFVGPQSAGGVYF
ncbi:hypothetical protein LPJ64_000252 [Coemansia asiatica]|uniref:Uncharacterized protein n=1 Tax=Coemansia asiatica TaxID=1052880 RepID=A0A9W8CN07_9FUNG|nr:hypothetical protein LPJ64_000252 [Coemansia asiatica]